MPEYTIPERLARIETKLDYIAQQLDGDPTLRERVQALEQARNTGQEHEKRNMVAVGSLGGLLGAVLSFAKDLI